MHTKHVKFVPRIRWIPSCEVTPFAPEMLPFKRGGLSSGVEINTFMFRFTLSSGLPGMGWPLVRVASQKGFYCISTCSVCIEQYISTDSKPVRPVYCTLRRVAYSVHATYAWIKSVLIFTPRICCSTLSNKAFDVHEL